VAGREQAPHQVALQPRAQVIEGLLGQCHVQADCHRPRGGDCLQGLAQGCVQHRQRHTEGGQARLVDSHDDHLLRRCPAGRRIAHGPHDADLGVEAKLVEPLEEGCLRRAARERDAHQGRSKTPGAPAPGAPGWEQPAAPPGRPRCKALD